MRVLHLVDPHADGGGPCTLRLMADTLGHLTDSKHGVIVLGGMQQCAQANRCGLHAHGSLAPPRYLPWSGGRALQRILQDASRFGEPFDLVHAWDLRSAALATSAGSRLPSIATLHAGAQRDWRTLAAINRVRRSSISILAASVAVRKQLKSWGVDQRRLAPMPPAVQANPQNMQSRDAVRSRWAEQSEHAIDDRCFIIGLLSEPPCRTDARLAVTIAARVALANQQVKLVVHESAGGRAQAEEAARQLGLPDLMIIDDVAAEPWNVVNGLDAALVIGSPLGDPIPASGLPLLWALAAGIPTVAERSDWARELIDDAANGFLVGRGDINAAADRLVRIADDPALALRLSETARQSAADAYNIDEYRNRMRHTYELLLANRSVRVVAAQELIELEIAASTAI